MLRNPSRISGKSFAPVEIFDRAQLRRNRVRATAKFQEHAFLHEWAQKQLEERLSDISRDFDLALHIGPCPPAHTKIKKQWHMDIAAPAQVIAEEDFLPFGKNRFDLITSAMSLHHVNDLPGALVQIRQALKPDGLFLACMPGGETLYELRQSLMQAELNLKGGASPRVFPFADKPQMGSLLQRGGFALPVVDSEILTVTYKNIFDLFKDLRGMGEGNAILDRSRNAAKSLFLEAGRIYQDTFSDPEGRLTASFEMIFLIGWTPHESQQKPLRPGSAKARLADALNAAEISTGEKARP